LGADTVKSPPCTGRPSSNFPFRYSTFPESIQGYTCWLLQNFTHFPFPEGPTACRPNHIITLTQFNGLHSYSNLFSQ
jgi:hypothetical protein